MQPGRAPDAAALPQPLSQNPPSRHYRLLQEVRERGAWEAWLEFFLEGVAETANQAFQAATEIVALFKTDRDRINDSSERTGTALRVHDLLQQSPFATATTLVKRTGLTAPTVNPALALSGSGS